MKKQTTTRSTSSVSAPRRAATVMRLVEREPAHDEIARRAHEIWHAIAAQRCGIEVKGITLFALGRVSRIAQEPRSAREELVIAAAGPLVSFALAVLGLLVAILAPRDPLADALAFYLIIV